MTEDLASRVARTVAHGGTMLFLSPHLDDAVLSCGALMSSLVARSPVTVVTVFSAGGPAPHTRAAHAYLRQCAGTGAAELYAARQQEDIAVLDRLGAGSVHLGVADALFRRREVPHCVARLGRVVPELVHRYPTFRFDVARGRVSRGDRALLDALDGTVGRLVERTGAGLVFCPLGVGRHVDHLVTRRLGERYAGRVVYYSDFPYDRVHPPDVRYVARHRLQACSWSDGLESKQGLLRGYRTQVDAMFPTGEIPSVPETYYLPPA